ncbi:MerR family transcriptional regulator [Acidovorax facilis]|uniref:MerR family transcriptional regulator n=1 Tax=Acidovorax facilis TaxID=12917 RepID=UPI003CE9FDB5
MSSHVEPLLAAEASRHLGVSAKALRLYEQKGLLQPTRTVAGYRHYSQKDLMVAQDIVALRALGLSLAQIQRALRGDAAAMDLALASREAQLAAEFAAMKKASDRLRNMRHSLSHGQAQQPGDLSVALGTSQTAVSLELPWPWDGEQLVLPELAPLTYLVGPLGSGKTRLALGLAQALKGARYLGIDRLDDPLCSGYEFELNQIEVAKIESHIECLREEGAVDIQPLRLLMSALEAQGGRQPLVVDMIEGGLTRPSQEALLPLLRSLTKTREAPVIAMTRSSSILDLESVGSGEAILFCPANHSHPFLVPPFSGAAGYEALSLCLATPEVRERVAHKPA